MKNNITLIGMPGSGKSSIGVLLARKLGLSFIDTDALIEHRRHQSLQQIVDSQGHLQLRRFEEEEIMALALERHVIATGGSAVYSAKAMQHLQSCSLIIFLDVPLPELKRRLHNFASRGIARAPGQSLESLFSERQRLYTLYADLRFSVPSAHKKAVAAIIARHPLVAHIGSIH